jgi:hypothetical protein
VCKKTCCQVALFWFVHSFPGFRGGTILASFLVFSVPLFELDTVSSSAKNCIGVRDSLAYTCGVLLYMRVAKFSVNLLCHRLISKIWKFHF